jgi:MFS family permease
MTTSLAGYLHPVYLGAVPMFFVLLLLQGFFGNGNSAISNPYMAEMWPGSLRGQRFRLLYGLSNWGNSSARPAWR